ncbi:nitrogen fixation protein [Thauera sp. CAU 1555]|uniref:Nitrogen fixation protein n=1 Tax=Thauera sedimentorum TaxID=2767595 RepID=A0ABR9B758_9RHOO|nr:NifB/NifX family molybdenum-iron cluster-binding protein [Thauera sedimentorum]MBC9071284.1 nitrogen fixation protein [Thauera sedimentorum]MBD8502203.1 nitrogen fixation protein [Thauera sedimentorum]
MKIAVTSQNFRTVTAHAGRARRFLIFDIACPCSPREVDRLDLPADMAFHDFRGSAHPLDGVDALITGSAGEGLQARLLQRGIELVVSGEPDPRQAVADYIRGFTRPPATRGHTHHGERSA